MLHAQGTDGRQPGSRQHKPKLRHRVGEAIRGRHYSIRTEDAYVSWIKRLILFHGKRHPREMGEAEVNSFLCHLAVRENVAASTQRQPLSAILFLYSNVPDQPLPYPDKLIRAKQPRRRPSGLTNEGVKRSQRPGRHTEASGDAAERLRDEVARVSSPADKRHRSFFPNLFGSRIIVRPRSQGSRPMNDVAALITSISTASWPIVVAVVIYVFRKQIADLIESGSEVSFEFMGGKVSVRPS
ncbi:MAG: hypothetical protein GY867_09595, partial [bacterium]|nr:hypothetical protein [bacterium]